MTDDHQTHAGHAGDEMISRARAARVKSPEQHEAARVFAVECAQSLRDDRCEHVVVLDVSRVSQVTEFVVIGTGTSERQMRAALSNVSDWGKERSFALLGSQGDERGTWLLADFVDVVVHVFEPNTRAHYDIEMLWGDSPRVEVPEGPGPWARRKGGS